MIRLAALTAATVAALTLAGPSTAAAPKPSDPLASLGVPDLITYETHGAYAYKCEVWTANGTVRKTGAKVIVGYIERCYLAGPAKHKTVKPKAKAPSGNGVPPA